MDAIEEIDKDDHRTTLMLMRAAEATDEGFKAFVKEHLS